MQKTSALRYQCQHLALPLREPLNPCPIARQGVSLLQCLLPALRLAGYLDAVPPSKFSG